MFCDSKILILGFARSGSEAARFLLKRNNKVVINDFSKMKEEDVEKVRELEELGAEFIFGGHPDDLLDSSFNYLIKSPGIRIDHPYVEVARKLGVEVINETEMAYRLLPSDKNITLIGITGTNGKTTTTTLIYEFLKKAGKRVHLAGNVGYPLCSFLDKLEEGDIIVDEVSCQQLEDMKEYHPNIGVLTNISEAHIEFMKTYEHYKEVKKRLFQNQTREDKVITNMDNNEAMNLLKDVKATMKYFSSSLAINGAYLENNEIHYYDHKIVSLEHIKLIGKHNYENIMAAILTVKEFDVDDSCICKVLKDFVGVEHRLEFVGEVDDRKFYNDTEATNIKCSQIALRSFNKPVILFLGGYERDQDFYELRNDLEHVKIIMAIGECRNRVREFGKTMKIPTYSYEFLKDAFEMAWILSSKDDIILLSPASASWDQYKQCEDRGDEFKQYVDNLIKERNDKI